MYKTMDFLSGRIIKVKCCISKYIDLKTVVTYKYFKIMFLKDFFWYKQIRIYYSVDSVDRIH